MTLCLESWRRDARVDRLSLDDGDRSQTRLFGWLNPQLAHARRLIGSAATARQPSSPAPRKAVATAMNDRAVPALVMARSTIATATVPTRTVIPSTARKGARPEASRLASQPAVIPARKGHAVLATPSTELVSPWLCLPMAANRQMSPASRARPTTIFTRRTLATRVRHRPRPVKPPLRRVRPSADLADSPRLAA